MANSRPSSEGCSANNDEEGKKTVAKKSTKKTKKPSKKVAKKPRRQPLPAGEREVAKEEAYRLSLSGQSHETIGRVLGLMFERDEPFPRSTVADWIQSYREENIGQIRELLTSKGVRWIEVLAEGLSVFHQYEKQALNDMQVAQAGSLPRKLFLELAGKMRKEQIELLEKAGLFPNELRRPDPSFFDSFAASDEDDHYTIADYIDRLPSEMQSQARIVAMRVIRERREKT